MRVTEITLIASNYCNRAQPSGSDSPLRRWMGAAEVDGVGSAEGGGGKPQRRQRKFSEPPRSLETFQKRRFHQPGIAIPTRSACRRCRAVLSPALNGHGGKSEERGLWLCFFGVLLLILCVLLKARCQITCCCLLRTEKFFKMILSNLILFQW